MTIFDTVFAVFASLAIYFFLCQDHSVFTFALGISHIKKHFLVYPNHSNAVVKINVYDIHLDNSY